MKIKFRVWDKKNNRMIKPKNFATVIPGVVKRQIIKMSANVRFGCAIMIVSKNVY